MYTLVSIEGNIGAGKSTLIEKLKQELSGVVFVDEPVEEWESIQEDGVTILEKYYGDQKRYAFAFQMMAFITRVRRLREAIVSNPNSVIITERSVFTDFEIFAKMLHDEGKIENIEYQIYTRWFEEFTADISVRGIIYVRETPETCAEHVTMRNRKGESIPLEYLKQCHEYHEKWLMKKKNMLVNPTEEEIRKWIRVLPLLD